MIGSRGPRMLRLTAQYADIWHLDGCNWPEKMIEPLDKLKGACAEVGRDLDTLEITARVTIAYPEIGQLPWFMNTDTSLTGTVAEIAAAIQGFEKLGVSHLMFHCGPFNQAAMAQLVKAVDLFRNRTNAI